MKALFVVLNHEEHFTQLLRLLEERGLHGGTILESEGMASELMQDPMTGYSYLRGILNEGRPYNKTLFMVLDEERVEKAKNCVREVTGNLESENTGIMFTFDVDSFEGLTK